MFVCEWEREGRSWCVPFSVMQDTERQLTTTTKKHQRRSVSQTRGTRHSRWCRRWRATTQLWSFHLGVGHGGDIREWVYVWYGLDLLLRFCKIQEAPQEERERERERDVVARCPKEVRSGFTPRRLVAWLVSSGLIMGGGDGGGW